MLDTEIALAVATWILVAVTIWMVCAQRKATREQLMAFRDDAHSREQLLRDDIRVRLQLLFADRFDSFRTIAQRKEFAHGLLANAPHDEIQEAVLNFFEDLGLFFRRGYFDEELAWSTFGFYAIRWWAASYQYISEERTRTNDPSVFTDFEALIKCFRELDAKAGLAEPTPSELKAFLEDERNLL